MNGQKQKGENKKKNKNNMNLYLFKIPCCLRANTAIKAFLAFTLI
jgi:hypothetical protein